MDRIDRRRLLTGFIAVVGAAWTGALGALAAAFVSSPLAHGEEEGEVLLGDLSIYDKRTKPIRVRRTVRDGWRERVKYELVYIREDAGGLPEVISSRCSHLGCSVRWNGEASEFQCPCHGGRFDRDGEVCRSAYMARRHIAGARRLLNDLEDRLEQAEDRSRAKRRAS